MRNQKFVLEVKINWFRGESERFVFLRLFGRIVFIAAASFVICRKTAVTAGQPSFHKLLRRFFLKGLHLLHIDITRWEIETVLMFLSRCTQRLLSRRASLVPPLPHCCVLGNGLLLKSMQSAPNSSKLKTKHGQAVV